MSGDTRFEVSGSRDGRDVEITVETRARGVRSARATTEGAST